MPRSKEEVISEMVDSGLFSDEEIRKAAYDNNKKSLVRQGLDALNIPSQMSEKGLKMLAGFVPNPEPTGNLSRDIALGTPRIMANTVAEAAPKFIDRNSIVTAGALGALKFAVPAIGALGGGIANQAEKISGLSPRYSGALVEEFKNPLLIFQKGKKAASPIYEAAKAEAEGANLFKGMYKPEEIFDAAKTYIDKGGKLEPTEALSARKALDKLLASKRYVKDELLKYRDVMDQMAKESGNISEADKVYRKGLFAEALRNWSPQNVGGTSSTFKIGIGTALANMGRRGRILATALSPIVQGTAAGALGTAYKGVEPFIENPKLGFSAVQLLRTLRNRNANKEKAGK